MKLGLRPERIQIAPNGDGLDIDISVLEDLGATRLIHGRVGGTEITVAQDADVPPIEGRAKISFRSDDAHFFDAGAGHRL